MDKNHILSSFEKIINIQSVSTDPLREKHVKECSEYVRFLLESIGCSVKIIHQAGAHPLIIGKKIISNQAKTIGIYAHYDVQPEDPVDQWNSPPFKLTLHQGKFFGRGVADDKGHLIQNIAAISKLIKSDELKNNIIFIFEGEEEIGSKNFELLVKKNLNELSNVDAFYITDFGMYTKDIPQIFYALRGIATFELHIQTSPQDVHSGVYGNAILNAAHVAAEIISQIRSFSSSHVKIPHFYDDVREISKEEITNLRGIVRSNKELINEVGDVLITHHKYPSSMLPKILPSFEVNGITSGYSGEGSKTIIPSTATIKFSIRLIEHQDPKKITHLVEKYIAQLIPKRITYSLKVGTSSYPFYCSLDNEYIQRTVSILKKSFNQNAIYNRTGGSVPAAEILQRVFQKPVICTGFTLHDSQIHAPNENYDEKMFWKGIDVLSDIYRNI